MFNCELVEKTDRGIKVRYQFKNTTDQELWVFHQVLDLVGPSAPAIKPTTGYVVSPEPGVVHLSKQWFRVPEDLDVETPVSIGHAEVAPGQALTETMHFPLPLQEHHPYLVVPPQTFDLNKVKLHCILGYLPVTQSAECMQIQTAQGPVQVLRYTDLLAERQKFATDRIE